MADHRDINASGPLLEATLLEAEKVVEVQREELDRLYNRSEGLVRLGVALVAGVIAATGLLGNASITIGALAFTVLMLGGLFLFIALLLFISVTTGFPRPVSLRFGPRVATLYEHLARPEWDVFHHHWTILVTLKAASESLENAQETLTKRLSRGISLLVLSTAIFAVTLALILGGTIHA